MATQIGNGSRPASIEARGLGKQFLLGEHRNLRLTVRRLLRQTDAHLIQPLEALSGVHFTVYRGEAVGLVGANGSGKSTLLQILAGTTLPTSGAMRVNGRVIPLLAVGLNFHPELTGRENVTLFASSLGIPRRTIEARMDAVTEFAELERHMDTPMKRFSSGMTSRLSFSIAMQFPADIYVFDEVLAVVDGEFQARCLERDQGATCRRTYSDLRQPPSHSGGGGMRQGAVAREGFRDRRRTYYTGSQGVPTRARCAFNIKTERATPGTRITLPGCSRSRSRYEIRHYGVRP